MKRLILILYTLAVAAPSATAAQYYRESDCPEGRCPLPQLPDPPATVPQPVYQAIVHVQNWVSSAQHFDGTGTLVAKGNGRALVVTCAHTFYDVDKRPGKPIVIFPNGLRYPARILGVDHLLDVLMLEIAEPPVEPLPLANVAPVKGDRVYSVGYVAPRAMRCQAGQAVDYQTRVGTDGRAGPPGANFMVTGSAPHEFSGGPMLDAHWKLCGVIYGTDGRVIDGVAFPRLRAFFERWRARRQFRRQHAPVFNRPPRGQAQAPWRPATDPTKQLDVVSRENERLNGELDKTRGELAQARIALNEAGRPADGTTPKFTPDFERADVGLVGRGVRKGITGLLVSRGVPAGLGTLGGAAISWWLMRRGRNRVRTWRARRVMPEPTVYSQVVEKPELKISRVATTDHDYGLMLEAMKREVDYNAAAAPIVERIQSLYQQLKDGVAQGVAPAGATLGWQDKPRA